MLSSADLVAFVSTTDPLRALAFYEQTLGLRLVSQTSYACEFDVGGTSLRVAVVERVAPAPYTVLGFSVTDIAASVRGLEGRGVAFARYARLDQDELGVWHSPGGARVAWFEDPDGNTLSLTELPRGP